MEGEEQIDVQVSPPVGLKEVSSGGITGRLHSAIAACESLPEIPRPILSLFGSVAPATDAHSNSRFNVFTEAISADSLLHLVGRWVEAEPARDAAWAALSIGAEGPALSALPERLELDFAQAPNFFPLLRHAVHRDRRDEIDRLLVQCRKYFPSDLVALFFLLEQTRRKSSVSSVAALLEHGKTAGRESPVRRALLDAAADNLQFAARIPLPDVQAWLEAAASWVTDPVSQAAIARARDSLRTRSGGVGGGGHTVSPSALDSLLTGIARDSDGWIDDHDRRVNGVATTGLARLRSAYPNHAGVLAATLPLELFERPSDTLPELAGLERLPPELMGRAVWWLWTLNPSHGAIPWLERVINWLESLYREEPFRIAGYWVLLSDALKKGRLSDARIHSRKLVALDPNPFALLIRELIAEQSEESEMLSELRMKIIASPLELRVRSGCFSRLMGGPLPSGISSEQWKAWISELGLSHRQRLRWADRMEEPEFHDCFWTEELRRALDHELEEVVVAAVYRRRERELIEWAGENSDRAAKTLGGPARAQLLSLLRTLGREKEAREIAQKVTEDWTEIEIELRMADAAENQKWESVIEWCAHARAKRLKIPRQLEFEARAVRELGLVNESERLMLEELKATADVERALTLHRELAELYKNRGDAQKELETLGAIVTIRPAEYSAYRAIVDRLTERGYDSHAIAWLRRWIQVRKEYSPDSTELRSLYSELGDRQARAGDLEAAWLAYTAAADCGAYESVKDRYLNAVNAFYKSEDAMAGKTRVNLLLDVLSFDPTREAHALALVMELWDRHRDEDRARAIGRQSLERNPLQERLLRKLAEINGLTGRTVEQSELLRLLATYFTVTEIEREILHREDRRVRRYLKSPLPADLNLAVADPDLQPLLHALGALSIEERELRELFPKPRGELRWSGLFTDAEAVFKRFSETGRAIVGDGSRLATAMDIAPASGTLLSLSMDRSRGLVTLIHPKMAELGTPLIDLLSALHALLITSRLHYLYYGDPKRVQLWWDAVRSKRFRDPCSRRVRAALLSRVKDQRIVDGILERASLLVGALDPAELNRRLFAWASRLAWLYSGNSQVSIDLISFLCRSSEVTLPGFEAISPESGTRMVQSTIRFALSDPWVSIRNSTVDRPLRIHDSF